MNILFDDSKNRFSTSPESSDYLHAELMNSYLIICEEFKIPYSDLTRDVWYDKSKELELGWNKNDPLAYFESFAKFKRKVLSYLGILYDPSLDKLLKLNKDGIYFISGIVAGTEVDLEFLNAIDRFCKENNAEFILAPIRPILEGSGFYPKEIVYRADYFSGNIQMNSNLVIKDFKVHAQLVNPTTRLRRYGRKEHSLIIAHTKMSMHTEPVANNKDPHIIHSTGCVNRPDGYRYTLAGMIAEQDHRIGGLIVEIKGDIFHIRQAIWNTEKKFFFDLDKRYYPGKVTANEKINFVMGDLHAGQHDPVVLDKWIDVINKVGCDRVYLHDAFDGISISHHAEGDFLQLVRHRPPEADTLEKELHLFARVIEDFISKIPTKTKIIMVPSNHPEWVERYLRYGKYTKDGEDRNHVLALELAMAFIRDGINPIQYFFEKHYKTYKKRITWLQRGDDDIIGGRQHAAHGDLSHSGSRGSVSGHEASYASAIYGHTHSPLILRDIVVVGTTTPLQVPYNNGQPTKWLNTSGLTDEYGNFQLINVINGDYTCQQ